MFKGSSCRERLPGLQDSQTETCKVIPVCRGTGCMVRAGRGHPWEPRKGPVLQGNWVVPSHTGSAEQVPALTTCAYPVRFYFSL